MGKAKILVCMAWLACWLTGRAGEAVEMRVGHFPNVTHAQAVLGRATGEFEKTAGLPIRWSQFNAGPSAVEALFAGALDASYIGPNPAVNGFLKSKGKSFCIVAGAASGGAALVLRPDAGIQGEKDFGGKKVATPQLGNTQDVAARVWFQSKGYRLVEKGGDLTLMPLANPDQLLMFQKRQIDAAWTIEPWVSRLEQEAGGRIFLEEKSLWKNGRYVTTLLVVSRSFLSSNRSAVKRLIKAHVAMTRRLAARQEALLPVLNGELRKETGKELSPAVLRSAMKRVEFTWEPMRESLLKSAEDAYKAGFLREEPVLDGIYDLSLLEEVLKEKDQAFFSGGTAVQEPRPPLEHNK
ncbi:MAG: ABC transporter substrate-binding protein [Verrucomicrobiae bacterium]|nr:ABC transporter substrate-binding protein [Verrucomicrobiae bacterium]